MNVLRGDVVLVDFPFASGTATKLRPAVVVQCDAFNARLVTTILAPITSNIKHSGERSQVSIDASTPDGAMTGLLRPSAVKSENLATVETRLVRRRIGKLPPALCARLDDALEFSLALP